MIRFLTPPSVTSIDERMAMGVSDAISAALSHVAACAAARVTDEQGYGLAVASRTARALGATHSQVTVAMHSPEWHDGPYCPVCEQPTRRVKNEDGHRVWECPKQCSEETGDE